MIKVINLKQRPVGTPTLADFELKEQEKERSISEGEILLETKYLSVDPYLRGRMSDAKSYIPPFEVGKPLSSGIVAEVIQSNNKKYTPGDFVAGMLAWKTQQISNGEGMQKIDPTRAPLSTYLGILGMTGLTAFLGLYEIGKPKKGETLLVSGAAGAVGSVVGQIGKILGLTVIGIAGSDEKVALLQSEFGFDYGINYKTTKNMKAALKEAAPKGIDIYFDNVGGPISDAVLFSINKFARMVICGAISVYNMTEIPRGISVQPFLIKNSALMQGFIVSNYTDKFPQATKQLATWLAKGKLTYRETIVEGFENTPQAFLDMMAGNKTGKMVIKV